MKDRTKFLVLSIKGLVSDMNFYKNIYLAIRIAALVLFLIFNSFRVYPQNESLSARKKLNAAMLFLSNNAPDSALKIFQKFDNNLLMKLEGSLVTKFYIIRASAYQIKGNIDSTKKFIEIAQSLYYDHELDENHLLADILYVQGWLFMRMRVMDSASYYFNRALEIATNKTLRNDSLVALIYRSLGNIGLAKRDYNSALVFYDKAYWVEKERTNYSVSNVAAIFQNKGIIFAAMDNNDSAKFYFKESLLLKEQIQTKDDPLLANGYMNFSRFLMINGDLVNALFYMNKAERIFLNVYGESYRELGVLYLNKGSLLILLNRYEEALTYLELSYQIKQANLDIEDQSFTELLNNLGIVYENLGQYPEAIKYHEASLSRNVGSEQKVKSLRWLASCYSAIDSNKKANEVFIIAISEAEKNLGKLHGQTAATYHRYGSFLSTRNNHQMGLMYLKQALDAYTSLFGKKNRDVSNVLTSMGLHYENMGDYRKALQYFQEALISFISFFDDKNYYNNPELGKLDPDLNIFNVLNNKSFSFYNLYKKETQDLNDLMAALGTIELTIELYQIIISGLDSEDSKLLLTSRVNEIYNLAVKVTSEAYIKTGNFDYLNLSFVFSEKSKASVLLSLIRETEAIRIGNIPESLRSKELEIKSEIAQYRNLIFEEKQKPGSSAVKISNWQSILNNKRMAYDSILGLLEDEYPEYYNLRYNFNVIGIHDIRKRLPEKAVLVEYKLVDSLLYVFVITRDTAILNEVSFEEGLVGEIELFISLLNTFPEVSNVQQNSLEFAVLGNKLFGKLFPSLIPDQSELIIIPDDILGYLSFDALVTKYPEAKQFDFRKLSYLIQKHPISYGYSATLFFNDINLQRQKKDLLAMAPIYSNGKSGTFAGDSNLRDLNKLLTPLKYTLQEVQNIAKLYRGSSLTGQEATESQFKARAARYNILHFAMHTLIDDQNPFASKLVFSLDGDTIDDGFLNTYEIYNLNLNAELAVLSACQTGVGKLNKGEGIMSLARGFLYAGVPGIVMTLWAIEDISSAEIITSFYRYLKAGDTKDHALRNAKLDYLENANQIQAHPYFWAAYVQIGNNAPLTEHRPNHLPYYILASLTLVAVAVILMRRKKSRL